VLVAIGHQLIISAVTTLVTPPQKPVIIALQLQTNVTKLSRIRGHQIVILGPCCRGVKPRSQFVVLSCQINTDFAVTCLSPQSESGCAALCTRPWCSVSGKKAHVNIGASWLIDFPSACSTAYEIYGTIELSRAACSTSSHHFLRRSEIPETAVPAGNHFT
jgi:hypothetical protein